MSRRRRNSRLLGRCSAELLAETLAAISLGCLQSFAGAKLHLDGDVMAEVVVPEL